LRGYLAGVGFGLLGAWVRAQDPVELKTNDGGGSPVVRLSATSGAAPTSLRVQNTILRLYSGAYLNVASTATSDTTAGNIRYDSGSFYYRDGSGEQTVCNTTASQTISAAKTFTGTITETYTGTSTAHILTANSVTANRGLDLSVTGLTTGRGLSVTGPSSGTAMTGSLIYASGYVGAGAAILDISGTTVLTSGGAYGARFAMTNAPASGSNQSSALYGTISDATALGTTSSGVFGDAADTGVVATAVTKTVQGGAFSATQSGDISSGIVNVYGILVSGTKSGTPTGGTSNSYGISATAAGGTGGTQTAYGGYFSASGADNVYGLYSTITADGNPAAASSAYLTMNLTKNNSDSRTFQGLSILPTLNTGGSNSNTTLNVLDIDTTNTATTGVTTNLLRASYGGTQRALLDSTGRLRLGTGSPNATLDISGSLAQRETSLTLANGDNNDVSLGTDAVLYRISGPSASFTVTGIAGGVDGRAIILFNPTGQAMTIKHNSTSSSAANRIQTATATDITITGTSFLYFYYSSTDSRWNLATSTTTPIIRASKGSDETVTSSTTFQNDDDLLFSVSTNETWYVDLHLFVNTGSSPTPDIKFQFTGPSGATIKMSLFDETGNTSKIITAFSTSTDTVAILGNTTHVFRFRGTITTASTAGTIVLQWAQDTSSTTGTTIESRSYLIAQRQ